MKKFFVNLLCAFIPKKNTRNEFRCYLLNSNNKIKGNNNFIYYFDDNGNQERAFFVKGLNVNIKGNNNKILIHKNNKKIFTNSYINMNGNNNIIKFEETKYITNMHINGLDGNNKFVCWGKHSTVHGIFIVLNEENAGFIVGEDCMFSDDISVFATDCHAIINKDTNDVLNCISDPITIGNHCWVGYKALLTKNCSLERNSVVGGGSVVTKKFTEPNIVVAGNPAKVIKRNVTWDRKNSFDYKAERY